MGKKDPLFVREMDDELFSEEVHKFFSGKRQPYYIKHLLDAAATLGNEANQEPRYMRTAWPLEFFQAVLRKSYHLRSNLHMMELVLAGPERLYHDLLGNNEIRNSDAWKACREDVVHTMGEMV